MQITNKNEVIKNLENLIDTVDGISTIKKSLFAIVCELAHSREWSYLDSIVQPELFALKQLNDFFEEIIIE